MKRYNFQLQWSITTLFHCKYLLTLFDQPLNYKSALAWKSSHPLYGRSCPLYPIRSSTSWIGNAIVYWKNTQKIKKKQFWNSFAQFIFQCIVLSDSSSYLDNKILLCVFLCDFLQLSVSRYYYDEYSWTPFQWEFINIYRCKDVVYR